MQEHRLQPLLAPRSVALVGASAREGTVSKLTLDTLANSGYRGEITLINPKYDEIDGYVCRPTLEAIGSPVDLAILSVGSHNLEGVFEQAVSAKARALVIFDGCYLEDDPSPRLLERLRRRAAETGVPVMGGNGMGFFNFDTQCHASFHQIGSRKAGGITLVAHSGSVATVLGFNDQRYRFNLLISSGQEIGTSVADYIDYAVTVPTTRAIALFMEAARDPPGLIAALEKAADRDIPVVICKVGRTEKSARLALSHTGAVTGSDDAFAAALRRSGAIKVDDLDEMMSTAAFLSTARRPGSGGFASVMDSGGLRELAIDLAEDIDLEFAHYSDETRAKLRNALPDILPVSNPLDAAGPLDDGFFDVFSNSLTILARDDSVAILGLEIGISDDDIYSERMFEIAKNLGHLTEKPVVFFSSFADVLNARIADEFIDCDIPVISGLRKTLTAVRNALLRRDLLRHRTSETNTPPPSLARRDTIETARDQLSRGVFFDESTSLGLLSDAGIQTVRFECHDSANDLIAAAGRLGFPLALKTAEPGTLHKTDRLGVKLNLGNQRSLEIAYEELRSRLGPTVIVAEMLPGGIELALGCVNDPDYGPLVSIGSGGTLVDLLNDRDCALAPFGVATATRLIKGLHIAKLLDGHRGQVEGSIPHLAQALSRFSVLCAALGTSFTEIDVNPIIVGPDAAVAADALVIGVRG